MSDLDLWRDTEGMELGNMDYLIPQSLLQSSRLTRADLLISQETPPNQPKEVMTMTNKQSKLIETKVYVRGTDIKLLSDDELYNYLQEAEDHITKLKKIKKSPKRLLTQIQQAQADIIELVATLDTMTQDTEE